MYPPVVRFAPVALAAALLTSCATPSETSSGAEPTRDTATVAATSSTDRSTESIADKPAEPAATERRSSSATTGTDDKLIAQLNEATREIGTLRAANAKLREQSRTVAPAPAKVEAATPKADPTDERLSGSLKSYAQFKQEMASFVADMDRLRKENADLTAQLKTAVEQSQRAKATAAELDTQLRAEKKARTDADKTMTQLREQLRLIARAVQAAGVNVAALAGTDTPARVDAADAKLRTAEAATRTDK